MSSDPLTRAAPAPSATPGGFATTHWSLVARAGGIGGPEDREALERLCRVYWVPLYAFARRIGMSPADAEDGTQGFFEHLLSAGSLARADPARGRFRTFLLSSFRNYLGQQHARAVAQKRGGGATHFALEALDEVEGQLVPYLTTTQSPEAMFDRHWALRVLEQALAAVEQEYRALGKAALFAELKTALWGDRGEAPLAEIARRLGTSEGAVKMAALRLRSRVRDALRSEVAQTLIEPADVEGELRHLLQALQS